MNKREEKEESERMLREYDFGKGERGKYAARFEQGSNIVLIDPDLAKVYPTSASVNKALRELADQERNLR